MFAVSLRPAAHFLRGRGVFDVWLRWFLPKLARQSQASLYIILNTAATTNCDQIGPHSPRWNALASSLGSCLHLIPMAKFCAQRMMPHIFLFLYLWHVWRSTRVTDETRVTCRPGAGDGLRGPTSSVPLARDWVRGAETRYTQCAPHQPRTHTSSAVWHVWCVTRVKCDTIAV